MLPEAMIFVSSRGDDEGTGASVSGAEVPDAPPVAIADQSASLMQLVGSRFTRRGSGLPGGRTFF